MSKPRVFVTRRIPQRGLDALADSCELDIWEGDLPPDRETLLERISTAQGILTLVTDRIDEAVLDAAGELQVISQMAVGYDNIDVAAATAHGIPVGNTPGVLTETTADLAFALLMAAARRLGEGERYVHAGKWRTWEPTLLLGQDVYGAVLGIVGLGRIGQAVARRARGFNMRLLYHGGSDTATAAELGATHVAFEELLAQSDFVSLHLPYSATTHHLIDERELALMKKTAILINTGRGGLVNPRALYVALRDGQIAYAALDVTEPEPIPQDDPLLTLDNCLIVPHIGSGSVATREQMALMAAENLRAGLRGEQLPHCVNPQVYNQKHS